MSEEIKRLRSTSSAADLLKAKLCPTMVTCSESLTCNKPNGLHCYHRTSHEYDHATCVSATCPKCKPTTQSLIDQTAIAVPA